MCVFSLPKGALDSPGQAECQQCRTAERMFKEAHLVLLQDLDISKKWFNMGNVADLTGPSSPA